MKNIIGLDPSLISTALSVSNGSTMKLFNYCRETSATGKTGLKKWFKMSEDYVTLRYIEYREFESYSEGELIKLKDYDKISDMIIHDIETHIDKSQETIIGIEGYSFNSDAGDLIDLVTFSTLIRKKLYDYISKDITVLSPSTLKLESCKLTYPAIDIGKKKPKLEYRNYDGIAGGNFTKREMLMSIIDNTNLKDEWAEHLRDVKDDLLSIKKVEKPYEDVNDAYLIYNILNK